MTLEFFHQLSLRTLCYVTNLKIVSECVHLNVDPYKSHLFPRWERNVGNWKWGWPIPRPFRRLFYPLAVIIFRAKNVSSSKFERAVYAVSPFITF